MINNQPTPESHSVIGSVAVTIEEEVRDYDDHLHAVQGLSAGTRKGYRRVVQRLLSRQCADAPFDFPALKPSDIRRFLNDELERHRTPSYASYVVSGLRSYLRYRRVCGDAVAALEAVVALWLSHESPVTTHQYAEADLTMKERALAKLQEPDTNLKRYRAPDSLLESLRTL